MSTQTGRRALAAGAAAVAALLGLAADQAAASVTASVQNGTLQVSGNGAPDTIVLRMDGTAAQTALQVDVGGDGTADFSFDRTTFTAINVQGGGGDDTLRLDRSGGLFNDKSATLDGGAGADTLIGDIGNDVLIGGSGNDFADGDIGTDTVQLGAGDDTFQWNPGDGSDAVDGGTGNDSVRFNASNANDGIALAANGTHVRLTRDIGVVTMDLDGVERAAIATLGGTDKVAVGDLTGTALKTTDVDLHGFAGDDDGAPDTVTVADSGDATLASTATDATVPGLGTQVHVTGAGSDTLAVDGARSATYKGTAGDDAIGVARTATGVAVFVAGGPLVEPHVSELTVQGLAGADTITAQNGIAAFTHLTLDGGSGDDALRGGDGADHIDAGPGNDFADGNIGADDVDLGTGNDTVQWDPGDGSDSLDGQGGDDTLAFNGSNASENIQLSANESRVLLFRDVAQVSTDFGGIEHLALRTLGGTDTVNAGNLGGTALDSAAVDLNQFGGGGDALRDAIVVNGTSRRDDVRIDAAGGQVAVDGLPVRWTVDGAEAANDTLRVNTLGGDDDVTIGPGVTDLIAPAFDLGAGE